MTYDPDKHHRRSIRLPSWDYRWAGAYFVTLVAHEREVLFGEIADGKLVSSEFGEVVARCWLEIPVHFPHVELNEWVLMPNHLHGIIVIVDEPEPTNLRGEVIHCGDKSCGIGSIQRETR
jgi:putative transposase